MKNRRPILYLVLAIVVFAIFSFALRGISSSNGIVVPVFASLSGPNADIGKSLSQGLMLAAKQINESGGINGSKLDLHIYDDQGTNRGVYTLTQKFIKEDHPTAVIGGVISNLSYSAAPLCNKAQLPMIAPAASSIYITQMGSYIFRTCVSDSLQGEAAAVFARQSLHANNCIVISSPKDIYSYGLAGGFVNRFTKDGGIIIGSYISSPDTNYNQLLTTMANQKVDVVYVPLYEPQAVQIAIALRDLGIKCVLLGCNGWDNKQQLKMDGTMGKALNGAYYMLPGFVPGNKTQESFKEAYKIENSGQEPDSIAQLGYDSVNILANAMKSIPKPVNSDYSSKDYRDQLRNALALTKDFHGVTGDFSIDNLREPHKSISVMQIIDGVVQYKSQVNP